MTSAKKPTKATIGAAAPSTAPSADNAADDIDIITRKPNINNKDNDSSSDEEEMVIIRTAPPKRKTLFV